MAPDLSRSAVIRLLSLTEKEDQEALMKKAYAIKEKELGRNVFLRGLIELSNVCRKNCLYCGIRCGNEKVVRYSLSDEEVLKTIEIARQNRLTSLVIQAGEQTNEAFINRMTQLITRIKKVTQDDFRITLSLGEQTADTYRRWFEAGAQRYLLRIETSSEELYRKIHPADGLHDFNTRLNCLERIREIGYQTGTGVMIGLPFQTIENLADDLLFIKHQDIDMVGMGPYIEHTETPLFNDAATLMPLMDRFELSLRMIAVLRLLMPVINIASTTALQAIVPAGRELGLMAGANVLMPNLTPVHYQRNYRLYEHKPCLDKRAGEILDELSDKIKAIGESIVYDDYGDSAHYLMRINQPTSTPKNDYQRKSMSCSGDDRRR
ncbi:MAG: [FeFe] hydrogenase H-cluster radical SAM maturase HydE [Bacteroidota bacterium]|nr:[FeFe] hydrogenase H-cluster radical SAM maturase HydE [Bacteroidota bacterium]